MGSKLLKNSFYNTIYQGFQALFPLLISAYISRVLQPQGVGNVSYANTVVTYFIALASLGLPAYGVKVIAQNNMDEKNRSKTFFELFAINFISTSICVILYFTIVNHVAYFSSKRFLLNIIGIQLCLNYFNIDWFFQGIEEYKSISLRSISIKVISFILMLIFVKTSSDVGKYALILCFGVAGNYVCNIFLLKKYILFNKYNLQLKPHIKPLFTFYAATLASQIYLMVDSLMIDYFYPAEFLGYYSNCVKIVRMVYGCAISIVVPFYPRINTCIAKHENFNNLMTIGTKVLVILAVPCVIGLEFLAKDAVLTIFGDLFIPSVTCLRILAPLTMILPFAYFNGQIVLISEGREKTILRITILSAVINASANYILIPILAHNGAAIASVLTELLVMIIVITKALNYYRVQIKVKFLLSCFYSNSVMIMVILLIRAFKLTYYVNLILTITLSVIAYFAMLMLTHNEALFDLLKKKS